jgi:hypothetical protein
MEIELCPPPSLAKREYPRWWLEAFVKLVPHSTKLGVWRSGAELQKPAKWRVFPLFVFRGTRNDWLPTQP